MYCHDRALASVYSSTSNDSENSHQDGAVADRAPNFPLLRHWLEDCVKNHPCAKSELAWPTRLLFVGSSTSQTLRLVESQADKLKLADGGGYAALSHCWGGPTAGEKERYCLTKENHQQRLSQFDLTGLPRTFRDAVQITRSLGLSLLWIDALCIIQTDPNAADSDWKKEAARMQDVFSSALVTICATSATGWEQGFCGSISSLAPRQELSEHVEPGLHPPATEESRPLVDNDFKRNVYEGPLNKRAWVLQERVLSRRLIHFTEDSTYWECGELVRCDDFRELKCGLGRDYFLQDTEFPKRLTKSGYYRTIDFLKILFQSYARFGLSVPSDRAVAISGLIERMEDVWQTKCRYGIFANYIHRLLLWRRQDTSGSSPAPLQDLEYQNQVPSWSWMICSRIEFFSIDRLHVPSPEELYFDLESEQRHSLRVMVREIDDKCTTRRDGNQLGILDARDRAVGHCWLDMSLDVDLRHCVVAAMDSSRGEDDLADEERTYYVVFVKHQSGTNSFERVGAGTIKARCVSLHACEGRLV